MTVRVYRSADAGAPTLTGQAGSMALLLDACLVDGYGSGETAKAPAGWQRAFSDTDKRVFRSGEIGGMRHYYQLNDDGSVQGGPRWCGLRGYWTMSSIDTGDDPYPSPAQRVDGVPWFKSNTEDATEREWVVVADARTVYVLPKAFADGAKNRKYFFGFGEFSAPASDAAHAFVCGQASYSSVSAFGFNSLRGLNVQTEGDLYAAGVADGSAFSIPSSSFGVEARGSSSFGGHNNLAGGYPSPHTGGANLATVSLHHDNAPRGEMRGVFDPVHANSDSYPADGSVLPGGDGTDFLWLAVWPRPSIAEGDFRATFALGGWP